jgi:hypothetical protein
LEVELGLKEETLGETFANTITTFRKNPLSQKHINQKIQLVENFSTMDF